MIMGQNLGNDSEQVHHSSSTVVVQLSFKDLKIENFDLKDEKNKLTFIVSLLVRQSVTSGI
jgi:hypothetical protein